jgi:hypothetical protein
MSAAPEHTPTNGTIRKFDIAQVRQAWLMPQFYYLVLRSFLLQVSLNLQDRLGLAKVKYQKGRLHHLDSQVQSAQDNKRSPLRSDELPDPVCEVPYDLHEMPLTSSPSSNPAFTKGLPGSARNKHAAIFNSSLMPPMLSASRKRVRSNSTIDRPAKIPRVSWKSSHCLPESSPALSRTLPPCYQQPSFVLEGAAISELPSPAFNPNSDEDNDTDLPLHSLQNISPSMISSSPPRTPPPKYARLLRNNKILDKEDGADLLLYLANSPTPAKTGGRSRDLLPSTPPSQHAVLPSLTSTPGIGVFGNLGTPNQQFNFADFVNVTPSPAQRPWGGRTPGLSKTPVAVKDARKRLNFDNIVPPSMGSPKNPGMGSGLALQLGDELRP